MQLWKKVAGIGLVALVLSAGLVPVPGAIVPGSAFAGGSVAMDPSQSGDVNPLAGDPDGPTGDVAPPTKGTISGPVSVGVPPTKQATLWAHWLAALKFWARFTFAR